ncbi:hypothetical protein B0T26DRAFT_648853 [Lasiosphaeria miniovina]|uniref:Uncharacterized protein n=1 Tax=Lasiosphaeria miniovina TaxID=1954250 RepID=A0AA40ACY3_9PEZI|nr:uncharacterized protein B0T26DRAFT_648853 [Lasiosphaeria miniovina]KAK0713455.1 hypothetical protein B0T26DRAFT_648853 [Lasiosphaeria miniovina]
MWRSQSDREYIVADTALPVSTLSKFYQFLASHRLSNGQLLAMPALSPDDLRKFTMPFNEWAPPPFNNNTIRSDSASNRLIMSISGLDQLFGMDLVDPETHHIKQRQWLGLVPLSDRRWAEKQLDAPENFDRALEHVMKAATVYFSLPGSIRKMRRAFTNAHNVLTHFDTVLDAHYNTTATGPPSPVPHLPSLASPTSGPSSSSPTWSPSAAALTPGPLTTSKPSPQQDALFTQYVRLANVVAYVDVATLVPLAGYVVSLPHWRAAVSPPIRLLAYQKRLVYLVRETLTAEITAHPPIYSGEGTWSLDAVVGPLRLQREAYARGRRELWGQPAPWREEMCIGSLKLWMEPARVGTPAKYDSWGFVGYRLWYRQSAAEWERFISKFNHDVAGWGAGVAGVDEVKSRAEIRWVDGSEHGIAEGDVEGARQHFKTLQESGCGGLNTPPAFLVADQMSIDAYLQDGYAVPGQGRQLIDEADLAPFVTLAAATKPEANRPGPISGSLPRFDGTVRVLGSVLLDDVWHSVPHLSVEDLWRIAVLHPSEVYVGVVTESQVKNWAASNKSEDGGAT